MLLVQHVSVFNGNTTAYREIKHVESISML